MELLWRGVANAWECDELGHLNVRFYLAKAAEAVGGLAHLLAMPDAFTARPYATLIARDITIRFLAEARPGAPLAIRGGILNHDEKGLTAALIMDHCALGVPAAAITVRLEHYSPAFQRTFPWSSRTREAFDALMIARPAACDTRSLETGPPARDAGLTRADALGLKLVGRGLVNADEVDALGHMRAEFAFGKISDGVIHFQEAFPDHWTALRDQREITVSGAVLEARIVMRRWPRAGEGYVIRSGVKAVNDKVRTLVHWVIDPATGANLWSMEAVACLMDLNARKMKRASKDEVAALARHAVDGLSA